MNLYEQLVAKRQKLAVVGLGYVGLALAIRFAKKLDVIGFDINTEKVNKYLNNIDPTNEVGSAALQETTMTFTSNETELRRAKFHIIAVPTPINADRTPNLSPLISASQIVGRNLTSDSIVVYESTVFPGVTEDICIPILEKASGLKYGKDFKVGYSPERVNPGDKLHTLDKITKIVSGTDEETLDIVSKVYSLIITAGIHQSKSIKIAEAAKVVENAQRDINIAFVNELALIFNHMALDTEEILKAAGTKWNFIPFNPGLVGGHCIGVDPYYLIHHAQNMGYNPCLLSTARKVNDSMGKYVAKQTIKLLIEADKKIKGSHVAILGITFKENCPDTRNTKVIDIANELQQYHIQLSISDPLADAKEVQDEYNISLVSYDALKDVDAVIAAVAHDDFKHINLETLKMIYNQLNSPILIDVKGMFNSKLAKELGYLYWKL